MAKSKNAIIDEIEQDTASKKVEGKTVATEEFDANESKGTAILTLRSKTTRTLKDALKVCEADLDEWEVERWLANKWDMAAKMTLKDDTGARHREELTATELWQVKVWFKRKPKTMLAREDLVKRLTGRSPIIKGRRKPKPAKDGLALLVMLTDLHMAMQCFWPQSQFDWDMQTAKDYYLYALEDILLKSQPYGKIEKIAFVTGSDMINSDFISGTTTKGTNQPESIDWHQAMLEAEHLQISAIQRCQEVAPTQVISIPGNHDTHSAFSLGRVMNAYFHKNKWVDVDASPASYKFFEWGINLAGIEHGHTIKRADKFIGLMANHDDRQPWSRTKYHMWILGDQHRNKQFEEQGVSFHYCKALTPANYWHQINAYNNQKRGADAFVLSKDCGKIGTIETNIDQYTGQFY